MSFSQWLNSNVVPLYFLTALTLLVGLRIGSKRGGWRKNLPYMFTLLICALYYLITPMYFYSIDEYRIIGTEIKDYYGAGAFYSLLGICFFILGYWVIVYKEIKLDKPIVIYDNSKVITILFFVLFGIIVINLAVSGTNVTNIFIGNETLGLGAKGETYFLQNFADSLIMVIILGYLYKMNPGRLLLFIFISFFLFSLLGFRYRIILTLIGLLFSFLYLHQLRFKQIAIGFLASLFFFYITMLSTENRGKLIRKQYSSLSYNPVEFNYNNLFAQTRGSLADMAIYKLYDNPNKNIGYDYGASLFAYIFVRMIPRAVYADKDSFYPPPQVKVQFAAYDAWWARWSGEAILANAAIYIAFGWLGVIFINLLWGMALKAYSVKIHFNDNLSIAGFIAISLASFQWITRGYLPQAVDHAVYLLIPIWILRFVLKRSKRNASI